MKTKVACGYLLLPTGLDEQVEAVEMRKICDGIDKGTLNPDHVVKGQKAEDIVAQMKTEPIPAEFAAAHIAEQERKEVAARVKAHEVEKMLGGSEKKEEDEEAKARRKAWNTRRKKNKKAKKKTSKLAPVDEDAPEQQSPPQQAESSHSGSSSVQSGETAMSRGTDVWAEHTAHEGSHIS